MAKARTLLDKLLLKPGQTVALLLAPADQAALFAGAVVKDAAKADAIVLYAASAKALEKALPAAAKQLAAGARLWICYPKAGQLETDLNRDVLWKRAEPHGFEGVRLVSAGEVWSAMGFRRG